MITKDSSFDKRKYLLENFQKAMDEEWLEVYYQPVVRTVNGRVCEEEALVRWDDPIMGVMNPDEFIPILEAVNVIAVLDLYVLDHVLLKMKKQKELGLYIVTTSINMSQIDFYSCDIVEEVEKRVKASGIDYGKIAIEIAESAIARNNEQVISQLEKFNKLGFKVWLDDYGSGNISPIMLQQVHFDLLKINIKFVGQICNSESAKIVITELIRLAMAVGIETAAEGVENQAQVDFLLAVGCAKLQGFYYCRPLPMEKVFARYETGNQIGFENPEEAEYYSQVGKISLYDLSFLRTEDEKLDGYFDAMPMGILEVDDDTISLIRGNKNIIEFIHGVYPTFKPPFEYRFDNSPNAKDKSKNPGYYTLNSIRQCGKDGQRRIIDDRTGSGKTIQVLMQRVAKNGITGKAAVAFVILSITEKTKTEDNLTYNYIARALSEDYIYLFFIDMDTGEYVEYAPDGKNRDVSVERKGKDFFKQLEKDVKKLIYKPDIDKVLGTLTKENIEKTIGEHGALSLTYRMFIDLKPNYVSLKAVKVRTGENRVIIGVSNVDAQMRQQETMERIKEERLTYARVTALAGDIICIYSIDPKTCKYEIYKTSQVFQQLQLEGAGEKFFEEALQNSTDIVYYEDLEGFKKVFKKKIVLDTIAKDGLFTYTYRICFEANKPMYVTVKAALVEEMDGPRLIVGLIDVDAQKRKELEYISKIKVTEHKANIDELTGVKNKNAYTEAEAKFNEQIKAGKMKKYAIVICDMNGLKDVNDNLGHLAGDEFIRTGCQIICNTFSHSPVYRVGGDEFAVIVQGKDLANLDYLLSVIDKANEENKAEGRVTFAAGSAYGEEGLLLGEVFERADANMYLKKKRMKRE